MIREHFNPGRGDVSQTGAAQANREVRSPADVTGSKLVAFQKEQHVTTTEYETRSQRELTRHTREPRGGGCIWDEGRLVRAGRDRARTDAAARGRGERRRGDRRRAARRKSGVVMEAIKETTSGSLSLLAAIGLTSGTPSHKGTSRGGAQSACMTSAHAVLARRAE